MFDCLQGDSTSGSSTRHSIPKAHARLHGEETSSGENLMNAIAHSRCSNTAKIIASYSPHPVLDGAYSGYLRISLVCQMGKWWRSWASHKWRMCLLPHPLGIVNLVLSISYSCALEHLWVFFPVQWRPRISPSGNWVGKSWQNEPQSQFRGLTFRVLLWNGLVPNFGWGRHQEFCRLGWTLYGFQTCDQEAFLELFMPSRSELKPAGFCGEPIRIVQGRTGNGRDIKRGSIWK